jgi:hypothetical protein
MRSVMAVLPFHDACFRGPVCTTARPDGYRRPPSRCRPGSADGAEHAQHLDIEEVARVQRLPATWCSSLWSGDARGPRLKVRPDSGAEPHCNPQAERFVKSVRTECMDPFVFLGERHLRHLLKEFMAHYLIER